jgi:hypothetical protein
VYIRNSNTGDSSAASAGTTAKILNKILKTQINFFIGIFNVLGNEMEGFCLIK